MHWIVAYYRQRTGKKLSTIPYYDKEWSRLRNFTPKRKSKLAQTILRNSVASSSITKISSSSDSGIRAIFWIISIARGETVMYLGTGHL